MAVETGAGNTEEDINFDVKKGGNECLTYGARARSVGAREAIHTWHGRAAELLVGMAGGAVTVCGWVAV